MALFYSATSILDFIKQDQYYNYHHPPKKKHRISLQSNGQDSCFHYRGQWGTQDPSLVWEIKSYMLCSATYIQFCLISESCRIFCNPIDCTFSTLYLLDQTCISFIGWQVVTTEPPGKPYIYIYTYIYIYIHTHTHTYIYIYIITQHTKTRKISI